MNVFIITIICIMLSSLLYTEPVALSLYLFEIFPILDVYLVIKY